MTVELNHTIVNATDKKASARFLTEILGLPTPQPFGPFHVVQVGRLSLDFADAERVTPQHYAFLVGENDFDMNTEEDVYHNWVDANSGMADALAAQGYHYQYFFARGAEHVDGRVIRQTLPAALEWLWQGYKPSGK